MSNDAGPAGDGKQMRLRYAGTCRLCDTELPAGVEAIYERLTRSVRCVTCSGPEYTSSLAPSPPPPPPPLLPSLPPPPQPPAPMPRPAQPSIRGVPGGSARREYQRRRANDEARIRRRWGPLGGVAVALSDEKQTTRAWAQGAAGEQALGNFLNRLASDEVALLHDCGVPGSRANIDHLAVTTAGVWVIDSKRYKGRPRLRIEGGLIRRRVEKLMVGSRDCTALADGVRRQVELVRAVVGDVPVHGVLCFIGADWPLIGGTFGIRGVQVTSPRRLAKTLRATRGPFDAGEVSDLLAARFRPA